MTPHLHAPVDPTMLRTGRTPGPWTIDDCDFGIIVAGAENSLQFVARVGDEFDLDDQAEADAAFIVRACNAHDAMFAALLAMRRCPGRHETDQETGDPFSVLIEAAIAKAQL